jgi:hypothetical protein
VLTACITRFQIALRIASRFDDLRVARLCRREYGVRRDRIDRLI